MRYKQKSLFRPLHVTEWVTLPVTSLCIPSPARDPVCNIIRYKPKTGFLAGLGMTKLLFRKCNLLGYTLRIEPQAIATSQVDKRGGTPRSTAIHYK
jgi:hypothetical protein